MGEDGRIQSKSENNNSDENKSIEFDSKTKIDDISTIESIQTFVNQLSNNYINEQDARTENRIRLNNKIINESNKIKAYQFKSKELITNKYGQKSYQRPNIKILQFENKLKCDKAKEILINCFPNDCQKIEYGINKSVKITPSIYLLSDKEILIMNISCENENNIWTDLKTNFKRLAKLNTRIIEAECGAIKWTK